MGCAAENEVGNEVVNADASEDASEEPMTIAVLGSLQPAHRLDVQAMLFNWMPTMNHLLRGAGGGNRTRTHF